MNDPSKQDKGLLVGKNLYIENNMTFDDQPIILENSDHIYTPVDLVSQGYETNEKTKLWHKWLQQEFKQAYKNVQFQKDGQVPKYQNENVDDVINNKDVKIQLTNKYN